MSSKSTTSTIDAKAPQSDDVSTATCSFDSSSDASNERWRENTEVIVWEGLKFGHQIQPYKAYAHCVDDIYVLSRFLELICVPDVEGDTVKLLLRALKFLRLCDYSAEDICSILAHASSYFHDAYTLCGSHMDTSEVGNILVTLMYIAHCYVQDETCPLHVWHQHLFRKYCPLRTLNAAIIRLLEIRKFVLRLETQDLNNRYTCLLHSIQKRRIASQETSSIFSKIFDHFK